MLRIIRALIALLIGLFSTKAKVRATVPLQTPKPITKVQKEEPVRFEGILVERPSWMTFEQFKRIRKEQQKRLKIYLRNPRYNGYMGYVVCGYNSPKHYAFQ